MAEWQALVQVCRRWQQIIYGSPTYLDLHLHCSDGVPFRKNLNRWPEFPLTLDYTIHDDGESPGDVFDLIDALEQPDRVHRIDLTLVTSVWTSESKVEEVLEVMTVPFPALTHLDLRGPDPDPYFGDKYVFHVDLPDDFLGQSAPCLQHIFFHEICFQGLPKLLLSTRGLVFLQLEDIPSDYTSLSPEAMAGGLTGLTRLKTLSIQFRYSLYPDYELEKGKRPELPVRGVLPALTEFVFRGDSKFLEELVARIDMPRVEDIKITYFLRESESPELEVRQLSEFIGRTANIELAPFRRAQVGLYASDSLVKLERPQGECHQIRFLLDFQSSGSGIEWEPDLDFLVLCMGVLSQFTPLLSNVGHLSFDGQLEELDDYSDLLPLLHLFPTVEELRVSGELSEHIATALENTAEERVIQVMPALHSLWLCNGDKSVPSIERFLSLRQLSGRPVTVGNTPDEVVV